MVKNNLKSKKNRKFSKAKSNKLPFPKKYYNGLSKEDTEKQIKELKKSRKLYKKGIYIGRTQKASFKSQKSKHLVEFEKKYDVPINDRKAVFKATGITPKAQNEILKKGMGAFYSSGSRPNQSAQSWALARLASVILKHGAYKVDRHILIENECDNIKPPSKSTPRNGIMTEETNQEGGRKKRRRGKKGRGGKKGKKGSIISCCKINEKNELKFKKCQRKSDGKIFDLPRRFNKTSCENVRGFTMKSSCAIYDKC